MARKKCAKIVFHSIFYIMLFVELIVAKYTMDPSKEKYSPTTDYPKPAANVSLSDRFGD